MSGACLFFEIYFYLYSSFVVFLWGLFGCCFCGSGLYLVCTHRLIP